MKKVRILVNIIIFSIFILFCTNVQATDIETIDNNENNIPINLNETLSVKAKVIEAGEVYTEEVSNYKIKYQDIKVEIKEGTYKGQVVTAKYSISYDLEGKIEGYPLNVGNTVAIELPIKDGVIDESSEIVVNDIVRSRLFSMDGYNIFCNYFNSR